ncbi:MAG: bifunctional 5,10-methylene-tetrahydrofolate dehydrogenase/5,10-methylene-tetrahydrofolate cyclohydrolase [Spirochaetales bacterium]|jgi:methylenetetrahydrofolate dehydrogenase (NADP+)/methenyltetrahydrofolate cyclohydrolase|nr:bifunctional 5,10-methylene-tetrahydrofolate dehydrogenase/5,10-methylene-tetrahydrofolate cyclohydrolase [Spirochaetales bacterium]
MAEILDGRKIASAMREDIRRETERLAGRGVRPGLAVILVGEDPASVSYVTAKEKALEEAGMFSLDRRLPESAAEEELIRLVEECNADPRVDGILVQLPLPKHINEERVLLSIHPSKDADGFHPFNLGKLMLGQDSFYPCTPYGIIKLLAAAGVGTRGRHVVIVGRSPTVGKPLANLLLGKGEGGDATVTVCHSATDGLARHTRQADILIAAAGKAGLITADMVKPGALVIDVGVNRIPDASKKKGFRLRGDTDFEGLQSVASKITPVPGGVGPMTITMLLYNTLKAAKARGRQSGQ